MAAWGVSIIKHLVEFQSNITEAMLFDYFLVSSPAENEVYTPFPHFIDKNLFHEIVKTSEILDKLVVRLITRMIEQKDFSLILMDDFNLKERILHMNTHLLPFFWTRFDAFERENGGIFFSEFNYDKPCAQKEIAASNMICPENGIHINFETDFMNSMIKLCEETGFKTMDSCLAILVDPAHYEELHLAQFYKKLLSSIFKDIQIVGGKNFKVIENSVYAFDKKIDIILRQFPVEFFDEMNSIDEILAAYENGKVLILNDPRAIITQSKSLFAVLWELVEKEDKFLSENEIQVIKNTIPYTSIYNDDQYFELINNKDKYVVKSVFGRYSQEVYIGCMHTKDEWLETLAYVKNSDKLHIIQEFCPIKPSVSHYFNGSHYCEIQAYANLGVYLSHGKFSGLSVRFSPDYLSSEENVWIAAPCLYEKHFQLHNYSQQNREDVWSKINEEVSFKHLYPCGYTGDFEAFTLDSLVLNKAQHNEISIATENLYKLFIKTTEFVIKNIDILGQSLGFSKEIISLLSKNISKSKTLIGRMDWAYEKNGSLKLLEFNSDTPAGLVEAIHLTRIIHEEVWNNFSNPNINLEENLKNCMLSILAEISEIKSIKKIGVITSSYAEDFYNTTVISKMLNELTQNIILNEVSALHIKDAALYLGDERIDALYRFYPLDWLDKEPYFEGVIHKLSEGIMGINPYPAVISQSKAFFALIYKLLSSGFFTSNEEELIKKYIPKTALKPLKSFKNHFIAKPLFGYEGNGIQFSFKEPLFVAIEGEYAFQQWIDIDNINLDIYSPYHKEQRCLFPIIGAFVSGGNFSGYYTRAGASITDKKAFFIPTFIEN